MFLWQHNTTCLQTRWREEGLGYASAEGARINLWFWFPVLLAGVLCDTAGRFHTYCKYSTILSLFGDLCCFAPCYLFQGLRGRGSDGNDVEGKGGIVKQRLAKLLNFALIEMLESFKWMFLSKDFPHQAYHQWSSFVYLRWVNLGKQIQLKNVYFLRYNIAYILLYNNKLQCRV